MTLQTHHDVKIQLLTNSLEGCAYTRLTRASRKRRLVRRGTAIGVAVLMLQGSTSALTTTWAAGCFDSPDYCVSSAADSGQNTLRDAVTSANASTAPTSNIGFADELFGIVRDSAGTVTSSNVTYQNPVTITLESTLEVRSDMTIKAPNFDNSAQILKIVRGLGIAEGAPLIAVNTPDFLTHEGEINGAVSQIQIENVVIDSNANPDYGNQNDPRSTNGVAIQVRTTVLTDSVGAMVAEVAPEVVIKTSTIINSVSDSGGGAILTPGDVVVENSVLAQNLAVTPNGGASTDGGAIAAGGAVTVVGSALIRNSATGDGGAIAATTVSLDMASEAFGNYAGGAGGAISATGNVSIATFSRLEFNESVGDGGAISSGGQVTISGSTISNNHASGNGGGVGAASVLLTNTTTHTEISNNASNSNGGAIYATESVTATADNPADIDLRTFMTNNLAAGSGGAIYSQGPIAMNNVKISGNRAGENGGGVAAEHTVTIENSVIRENAAGTFGDPGEEFQPSPWGGNGGAISATETVTVTNTNMESNVANSGFAYGENGNGGAIYAEAAVAVSNGSSFAANYAGGSGGAIYAIGNVSVAESSFGYITQANPNYNPVANIIENTAYDPRRYIANPGYNPRVTIANPDYNVDVPSTITNPTYGTEILGEVPNPDCAQDLGQVVNYDGQCFFMDTHREGDAEPLRYPLTVTGLVLDTRESIPNPLFDDREFLNTLLNPSAPLDWRSEISNPDFNSNQLIQICADPMIACDSRQSLDIGNRSDLTGGAIFVNGSINVSDSFFSNNQSVGRGGAIYLNSLLPDFELGPRFNSTISASAFIENQSVENRGGAIFSSNQYLQISDSIFEFNSAGSAGGAIRARDGALGIQNSRFNSNVAGSDGGAIDTTGAELSVIESEFTSNSADDDGGAIFANSILLARSAFETNTSNSGNGGAIYLAGDGQSVILNSVFEGNQALNGFGGAIYGPSWMLFNDFIRNNADTATAIALTGTLGTNLVGNLLQGPDNSEASLCNLPFWNSPDNYASDGSCFFGALDYNGNGNSPSVVSEQPTISRTLHQVDPEPYTSQPWGLLPIFTNSETSEYIHDVLNFFYVGYINDSNNYIIHQRELLDLEDARSYVYSFNPQTDYNPDFSYCPDLNNRANECIDEINQKIRNLRITFSDSSQDLQNMENIADLNAEAGGFLLENLALNLGQIPRSDSQLWSVGAFQEFLQQTPEQETPSNNEISESVQHMTEHHRSSRMETDEEHELTKIAELKIAEERAASVAAKIEAKKAHSINRQLKIAAINQKIAATKARGVELKKKIAWINLMRNFYIV